MPDLLYTHHSTRAFSDAFYGGTGASPSVPGMFPIALNGRAYLVDEKQSGGATFRLESLDIIRQQADDSDQPSEATITPEGLWRRAQEDWTAGAGQTYRDHPSSNPSRFRSSKGIDPWEPFQLTALPATDQKLISSATNLHLLPASTRLYASDGNTTKFTTDITAPTPTWTNVSGTPAEVVQSLASDGTHVWICYAGTDGIYETTTTTTPATALVTDPVSGPIGYVKGRLMAAHDNAIYNIVSSSPAALPTALFTHGNDDFRWVGFAEGAGQIYVAGYAGDKSLIYRTAVKSDGTALDAPVVAGELPTGEIVTAIHGYLGYVVIGTSLGVRFAVPNQNGDLVPGALIETPFAVRAFTAQSRFVWFGWSNYDDTSTGLGRLDLTTFTKPNTPAYASDIMADEQAEVIAATTFQGRQVFSVSGEGIWAAEDTPVTLASIDSGLLTYGIPDPKVAMYLDISTEPLAGAVIAQFSPDSDEFETAGVMDADLSVSSSYSCNQSRARAYETRIILFSDPTVSPILKRWTLRSYPAPSIGFKHVVPIILHETINVDGVEHHFRITEERERFRNLANTRALVTYQEGDTTHTVFVDSLDFIHNNRTHDGKDWNGLLVLTLKELPE